MKVAILQLCSSDDPYDNLRVLRPLIDDASRQGATLVCTPEVTNCVSMDRVRQRAVLRSENDDLMLAELCDAAAHHRIWISIGSLALKGGTDDRFVNRSILVGPSGDVMARYDKIHMFDVTVSETERYHESSGYAPGNRAVLGNIDGICVGLTICYDLRFPHLYRHLAQSGADVILVPSAFSPVTGAAHWEPLIRARAIENGCFVIAAAQSGTHPTRDASSRQTYGHSMVVDPWGAVLMDAGTACGITCVDLDIAAVSKARGRIPSLQHDRVFEGP